jgi:tRNA threonylcarbamoyl adenosine modification protein YeaZ/ribosomal-protein-alanine acetyltransferase
MVMLALDTSLESCSAALFVGAQCVAARFEVLQRGHAERLPEMVSDICRKSGFSPKALTRVAVTRGPGTFTGVRIGLSYARGLGLARNIPVIGIDTLTATAVPHVGASKPLLVVHTAGGTGKVYAAALDGRTLMTLRMPALLTPLEAGQDFTEALIVGTAAGAVAAANPSLAMIGNRHLPDAALFGAYALDLPPPEHPADPLYLREADAKPSSPPSLSRPHVRHAGADDIPLLAAMHRACFVHGWTEDMLRSSLSLPGSAALVAELAGRAYGFLQYQWIAGEAEVNTLCVLPAFRRQGFGRLLMDALVRELTARRSERLFLEVAADNAAAVALYRKMGFAETGKRAGYYARTGGPAADAITMTLAL